MLSCYQIIYGLHQKILQSRLDQKLTVDRMRYEIKQNKDQYEYEILKRETILKGEPNETNI